MRDDTTCPGCGERMYPPSEADLRALDSILESAKKNKWRDRILEELIERKKRNLEHILPEFAYTCISKDLMFI